MKIFFQKNDNDIEDYYFLCSILAKLCVTGWGRRQTGRTNYFFSSFIKIREGHRDIQTHSNNKVVINFSKPKFTITSY